MNLKGVTSAILFTGKQGYLINSLSISLPPLCFICSFALFDIHPYSVFVYVSCNCRIHFNACNIISINA